MKVVILAGGRGTRLAEETEWRPKPMVEIGGRPILWHIMSIYSRHGFREFLIACGYKGELIKRYFYNFHLHDSDFFIDLRNGTHQVVNNNVPDWEIGLIDTGLDTMTGGRILALKPWLQRQPFMVTYGDGVADIDLGALAAFHRSHGKLATVTAVRPPSRFGSLVMNDTVVERFAEKSQTGEGWINGGFFVFEPEVFDYLTDRTTILEREPLERLAADGQLIAYRHHGFWQPMDTLRDKELLESMWKSGEAPWRTW
jgi:glucose-1-phosphate cytidylyltransferase